MLNDVLSELGLSKKEITIYLQLLRNGSSRASTVAYQVGLPRTTVQNILNNLEKQKLVSKSIEKKVYFFTPVHPDNLAKLVEMKKKHSSARYDRIIDDLQKLTPQLVSIMKSSKNIPQVQFFRGRDAVRTVLFDTLTSKTELKGFVNADAMFSLVDDINKEYVEAREKSNVTKRGINIDTPIAREKCEGGWYSPKSYKDYRFIDKKLYDFDCEVNIYDGKVSYLTYVQDDFIGVIIENKYIYEMHVSMWNFIWDHLPVPKKKRKKGKKK